MKYPGFGQLRQRKSDDAAPDLQRCLANDLCLAAS